MPPRGSKGEPEPAGSGEEDYDMNDPDGLNKSLCWAYFYLCIGGVFGLHHWYLQRYRHMLLWMASGGGLGIGLVRDLYRMPQYVLEANRNIRFVKMEELKPQQPGFSFTRSIGLLSFFIYFMAWAHILVPDEYEEDFMPAARMVAFFLAVQILYVGRETLEMSSLKEGRSLFVFLACWVAMQDWASWHWIPPAVALYMRTRRDPKKDWPRRQGILLRLLILLSAFAVTYGPGVHATLYHVHIETRDGERLRLVDVFDEVFKSPLWGQFKERSYNVYLECWEKGWDHCKKRVLSELDVEGEASACQTLGVSEDADWGEIKKAYRVLSRKLHPDVIKNPTDEDRARYVEINAAYDKLSKLHRRRGEKAGTG